jgi:hypothetical protein
MKNIMEYLAYFMRIKNKIFDENLENIILGVLIMLLEHMAMNMKCF